MDTDLAVAIIKMVTALIGLIAVILPHLLRKR
jgi:hypothetical protein